MSIAHKLPLIGLTAVLLAVFGILFTSARATAAALPDNRVWEKISPQDKDGGEVRPIDGIGNGGLVQASPDGEKVTYTSFSSFAEAEGAPFGSQYLSTRQPTGWSTQNISPRTAQIEYSLIGAGTPYKAFTPDLSTGLLFLGQIPGPPSEPEVHRTYHLRDTHTGTYTPLEAKTALELSNATSDLKHILIRTPAALTANAVETGEENVYEWTDGQYEAINIPPNSPNNQTTPNNNTLEFEKGVISSDGARVFWTSETNGVTTLYLRDGVGTPQAHTIQIDASHGTGPSGDGVFQEASSDGKRVFFLDKGRLTPDSTAGGVEAHADLYEFDVGTGVLRDLSVDGNPGDPLGASVLGLMGSSEDGSYVYFVADGALPQAHANSQGQNPVSGQPNVYLAHGSTLTYITKITENDERFKSAQDWSNLTYARTTRVSADGSHLVFMAAENLTGYDSLGMQEVYLYDANHASLTCVSCNPSGAAPIGPSSIPLGTGLEFGHALYDSRVLSSDSSRVFFDSSDALTPQDTNARQDVYEWEVAGSGSCTSLSAGFSARSGGCVSLISGGTYNTDSSFVDASESGSDVFFITGQQLVSQDTDELADLYDARENGGITPPPVAPVCSGTGCQGAPPAPPIFATPSTATFAGEGNLAPPAAKPTVKAKAKAKPKEKACRRGLVRKHGRCVKKPSNTNRRAGR